MISHSKPDFDGSDLLALKRVLASGQASQGPEVQRAERAIASLCGASACAAVCSGTKALELALRALGIGAGDEVIVPSYCCSSVAHAVLGAGARCVPADIESGTYHLSADSARERLTRKTKALVMIHSFGLPDDPTPFRRLGRLLIEDCAPALGARLGPKPAGSLGDASIFSFYSTKMLAAGEGGMVASRRRDVIGAIRYLRECDNRPPNRPCQNVKWTDLQAGLLLSQLRRLDRFRRSRRRLARAYDRAFKDLPIGTPIQSAGRVYWRYVIRCPKDASAVLRAFERRAVRAKRPVERPLHWDLGGSPKNFPCAEEAWARCVSLPIYPGLSATDQRRIIDAALEIFS